MKPIITILFLLVIQAFSAQEEDHTFANGVFHFEDNKTQKIFTDWTRVRMAPDVNAQILDSLRTNQKILILNKDKTILKLGERRANWYRISYSKNGKPFEGYLWGGNLCVGYRTRSGYDFLFGLTKTLNKKNPESDGAIQQNYASVKMVDGENLIDEISFETGSGESLSYATFDVEGNHRLKNVEFTLKTMVSGEACGVPSYDQYILFTAKKLIVLPQLMNVGDADVYYHSEEFVFPDSKGGNPNIFILRTEEMEKDENDQEKIKYTAKAYFWDGNSFRLK